MSIVASDFFTDMGRFDAKNFISTELNDAITVAQTVITIKDSTVWPSLEAAGSYFIAVITHATDNSKKEVVKVTAISGANWTIQREYEGNQSYAFPAGSSIECRLTAATLGAIRGVTYKKTPFASTITAKPHTEYLMEAGHQIRIYPTSMEEGSIIRATALQTSANNPVTVLDAGGAVIATLGTAGSFVEFCVIAGVAVQTKLYRNTHPDYQELSASFAAIPNVRAILDMSDDVNKTVTVADGFADSSRVTVNLTKWGDNVDGKNVIFQFQTEPFVAGNGEYDSLIVDAPCIITLERVGGKWYIASSAYSGDYGALEKRVDVSQQKMHVVDEKSASTAGGASVAGTQTRALNTVLHNSIDGASLASNMITLPKGEYKIRARAPAFSVNIHMAFLVDDGAGSVVLTGSSEYSQNGSPTSQTWSVVEGVLTVAAETAYRVTHTTQTAKGTNGLGVGATTGFPVARFTEVFIERIS